MNDIEDKIKNFLSSPESMEKVMSFMKNMSESGSGDAEPVLSESPKTDEEPAGAFPVVAERPEAEAANMFGGFDGLDPKTVSMAVQMMREYNCKNDRRILLLNALRPYLKNEDHSHIEKAMQIIKLAKVAKKALRNFSGGDMNV
ncbi:MAG: hypothetical protein GX541_05685 [Clostridiales bacterium]|nr:hypothetical protein [Clostridiales bacterium]